MSRFERRARRGMSLSRPTGWMLLAFASVAATGWIGSGAAAVESGSDAAFAQHCAVCHGAQAEGGPFAPTLKGAAFRRKWAGSLDTLYGYVATSMPPTNAGGLPPAAYGAAVAFVAAQNGADLGEAGAAPTRERLARIAMPAAGAETGARRTAGVGGLSSRVPVPPSPALPDRFARFTPVTEAMLTDPPPQDWPSWRRSHRSQGFSPLAQITTGNVGRLRVAWAQPLPAGANFDEPLVHDGVLYMYGYGDEVFAYDAASGRSLWRYRRQSAPDTAFNPKKNMALWGDKLFFATSDLHMVALDARSGRPVWDKPISTRKGDRIPGGPLIAQGVVMQGIATQAKGGGLIAGFDAESGERLWTFNTVAAPGQPGGDSWNGIPGPERAGASVWTSGSYDAATGLALWGTGNTYDTGPLRIRKPGMSNDALYTESTLALEPRTGRLAWHFQHMKNDQYDLDWTFDRVIGTLKVNGADRRVVMTSGKEGLFDALDAKTGRYVKTVDMGLQNFVTRIDPATGDKTVDPALLPGAGRPVLICPNFSGGRSWPPTAFDDRSKLLFVAARDVCMDLVPGGGGFLSSGVDIRMAPRPGSDGRYGVLQALDMQAGRIRWEVRQRAPYVMGVLATAGGLLFTGSADRRFLAYDAATGKELWHEAMADVPNGAPVSYAVDGRQYVAMVVSHGNPLSGGVGALTPEIQPPPVNSSAVYVFALPD